MKIGVARVSTRDQHLEAQEDALRAAGCETVFTDKASGNLARRPELYKALLVVREGDHLVVTKLDRLGRSLENLIELSKYLRRSGVDLVVLDQGIDTSTRSARCSSTSSVPSPSSRRPWSPSAPWTGRPPRGRGAGPAGRRPNSAPGK